MSTNEFARILLTWIKSFLSWIGIPRDRLNELDEIIFLILIVVIAFAVGAVFHYLSVRFTRKVLKYKKYQFFKFVDRIQCLAENVCGHSSAYYIRFVAVCVRLSFYLVYCQ